MALRTASMRLRVPSARYASSLLASTRRYASTATASKVAETTTALTHPDPTEDSPTGRLVHENLKFMVATYVRPLPVFQRGEGVYLWDTENRRYLDLTGGIAVNALGHCDPDIAEIIHDQSKTLMHTSNLYHTPWIGALSRLLVETTVETGGMHDATRAFICNSGTEANEAAIKFARKVGKARDPGGDKIEIVSFHNSFHGRTLGALSATPTPKYQAPFAPLIPGFRHGHLNDIAALEKLVTPHTAGVLVEPIQGEGGVNSATPEFLTALAARCREVGAVLIYDEIQCGLGRTGTFWAHATLPKTAHPDMITTAKALGNGFPIGGVIVNEAVASAVVTGDHGTTFGGNPLGCRVAHHIVGRIAEKTMLEGVQAKERVFRQSFARLQQRWPEQVKEVRGRGLILGLQMSGDPTPIVKAARERGLLIITAGMNTLRFVPSLTISGAKIEEAVGILEEAMESVL
ncbi:putative acetylornithine aminotransferase precursor, partial [Microthyrium microscopicum]